MVEAGAEAAAGAAAGAVVAVVLHSPHRTALATRQTLRPLPQRIQCPQCQL